jgi:hypothetical protein
MTVWRYNRLFEACGFHLLYHFAAPVEVVIRYGYIVDGGTWYEWHVSGFGHCDTDNWFFTKLFAGIYGGDFAVLP